MRGWSLAAIVLLAFLVGAFVGGFGVREYDRRADVRQDAESQQAAAEASNTEARRLAELESQCPLEIQRADAAVAEQERGRGAERRVERGIDQRAFATFVSDRWVVAGELTLYEGDVHYPLRYIRRPHGTIESIYGDRVRDAEFQDTWRQIAAASLCVVYD